jgi:hypothetical protein
MQPAVGRSYPVIRHFHLPLDALPIFCVDEIALSRIDSLLDTIDRTTLLLSFIHSAYQHSLLSFRLMTLPKRSPDHILFFHDMKSLVSMCCLSEHW